LQKKNCKFELFFGRVSPRWCFFCGG